MIAVTDWTRVVPQGAAGVVWLTVSGAAPVTRLEVDLLGDGRDAPTVVYGADLRRVRGLAWVPPLRGAYGLQVRAMDIRGCVDATGMRREVEVQ